MQALFSAKLASELSSWAKGGEDPVTEWMVQLLLPRGNGAPGKDCSCCGHNHPLPQPPAQQAREKSKQLSGNDPWRNGSAFLHLLCDP